MILYIILAAGYIMAALISNESDSVSQGLFEFIAMNCERLQSGETLEYLGSPINMGTRLVRYRYCFSYFIATSTRSSGLYIIGSRKALGARIVCILTTFFAGWWGIPWGPIKSVQCLFADIAKNGDLADTVGGILKSLNADTSSVFSDSGRYM